MSGTDTRVEKSAFWGLVLEEHASSGLSVRAFCQRESLSEPSFYSWRRKLQSRAEEKPSPSGLIPVRLVDEAAATGHVIEIVVPGNVRLRVQDHCSTEAISRVLSAVCEAFSC